VGNDSVTKGGATIGRLARDDEVAQWSEDGYVVLDGLVSPDVIDAAMVDVWNVFPKPEKFHENPEKFIRPGKRDEDLRRGYPDMPEHGPWFRPEQHRWGAQFPFWGTGNLSRLCVHPAIVDFAERALETTDVQIYQTQINAKYTGDADYEQPMHTDRNHSWLPPLEGPPWWHVEMFLYLSDVEEDCAPTNVVSRKDSGDRSPNDTFFPTSDPEIYALEKGAAGIRGSLMAYRNDTFHRGVDITRPKGSRFLYNVSYKVAGMDWVGFHAPQNEATHPSWVQFAEASTPRELELFGFPPPGHDVWTPKLIEDTQVRYPGLDLDPWRKALAG
jgi:hypothetical protein